MNVMAEPAALMPWPVVLYFHHIGPVQLPHHTSMSLDQFERAVDLIATIFEILPAKAATEQEFPMTPAMPPALLSFDDGYEDTLITALPLLEARKLSALLFVITGMVGKAASTGWGGTLAYGNWASLQAAAACGHVVASHTHQHQRMDCMSRERACLDVFQSQALIRKHVGSSGIRLLAYPFGYWPREPLELDELRCFSTVKAPAACWTCAKDRIRRVYLDTQEERQWKHTLQRWARQWWVAGNANHRHSHTGPTQ